jgi:hypothetical protein
MVRPGRVLTLTLQLLVTGVVTWFIIRTVGLSLDELESLDLSRWRIRWAWLFLSSVLLLLAYLYLASLWGLMVRDLGGPPLGVVESLRVWFTANLGRYLPGKVWQVAGLAYLAGREGVTAATATASALLGQGFSLGGATVVGLGVLLGGGGWAEEIGGGWSAAGLLGLLVILTFPGILKPLLRLWFRLFRKEIPASFRPDQVFGVRWLLLYALGWLLQGIAFWCLTRGLGLELGAVMGIAAYPAAYVLGYVMIFAPAGIGVREGFLIVFLDPILGAGAAVPAVVSRLWSTLLELVPALGLAGGYLSRPGDRAQGGGRE